MTTRSERASRWQRVLEFDRIADCVLEPHILRDLAGRFFDVAVRRGRLDEIDATLADFREEWNIPSVETGSQAASEPSNGAPGLRAHRAVFLIESFEDQAALKLKAWNLHRKLRMHLDAPIEIDTKAGGAWVAVQVPVSFEEAGVDPSNFDGWPS